MLLANLMVHGILGDRSGRGVDPAWPPWRAAGFMTYSFERHCWQPGIA
jgi:hypothetical protein